MKRQEKSTTVRRVIVNEFGGAEQLRVEPVEELPRPGAGQVLVDVELVWAGSAWAKARPMASNVPPKPIATSRAEAGKASCT